MAAILIAVTIPLVAHALPWKGTGVTYFVIAACTAVIAGIARLGLYVMDIRQRSRSLKP
ncbi:MULTISPECIES: hypothetical protein [unclassified Streptomyces]|uniref:hypothetical protein n=1 Tax=unclassified Streptomyces TaxID=2593676 RepID=UPI00136FD152|nr:MULTISPECIES: hypothetical protein [unclassified Streptomyces]MYS21756.1 hypothetical protein [Streptomyces sp. SID4948]